MKILKISYTVKDLLRRFPDTRDSDELLILKVWAEQNPKLRGKEFSFIDFSYLFMKRKFASTESIRRSRQKIQEEFKEFRGNNYKERHNHQEDVKNQLKDVEILKGGTP